MLDKLIEIGVNIGKTIAVESARSVVGKAINGELTLPKLPKLPQINKSKNKATSSSHRR